MSIRSWKVLESEYLLRDPWMTVRADHCETDQGVIVDSYFVHESCDWVHVLALNENNEVLLTRQYRHAAGEIMLELPAGCVEKDEQPLAAMKRELLEETGCVADEFIPLAPQSPNPARCNNLVHPYVARRVRQVAVPIQPGAVHERPHL
jgi:8-oxo-dGTP pyrophosphatase MutT (NUDIX family)